jgi:hypothetical protein
MRAWRKFKRLFTTTDTTLVTTAETVVATLGGVSTQSADGLVQLDGFASLTTGTGVTAAVVRVRRGIDATGTLIGEATTSQIAASLPTTLAITVQDAPGEGTFSYVLTVQQTAATGNGTCTQAALTSES